MSERAARWLYSAAWFAGLPFVAAYLLWRSLRQREYLAHWGERFLGRGPRIGGDSPIVWVHAVSVGETRAAQPLIESLANAHPELRFVLTHMTPTGRAVGEGIARALPGRVVQRYLPYDLPFAVRRFLREARPRVGIVLETEVWPNLLFAARDAGVPMLLVNARLSAKSLGKALRWPALVRAAVACFARIAAQTAADRDRIARLYAGPIDVIGNLKFDLAPPENLLQRGRALRERLGNRAVWLFASTREGEEPLLVDAIKKLGSDTIFRKLVSDPILLVVPRHPQRFDEVAQLLAASGLRVVRRSGFGETWPERIDADALLGDSMGEMAMYYAAADVALIGGSLKPRGGQNLIEACACGCPVVVGPHMFNFEQATRDALDAGAAIQVDGAEAALRAMADLTSDPARLESMRAAALRFAQAHRGATARAAAIVEGLLSAPAAR
ncbi:MAG: lipid IV(A) 3-deoxy-D-manno-octulosonic acid transferase [Burkholderiaceae bacterium]|nr:lipid IV(A) 3-deoxy-D-manno-octulosonic acid transferase [Burkholderiaceae bacterium]